MQDTNSHGLKALIAGATGLTGSFLLPLLLNDSRYAEVIVLSRRTPALKHPKIKLILTEGKNLEEISDQLQADHVFCCLGTTMKKAGSREAFEAVDLKYPVELAKICRQNGAGHFLLISALGANPDSGIYYSRIKGLCEEKIKALGYPRLSIFRPSILDGPRTEHRAGEALGLIISRLIAPLLFGGMKKYRPTKVQDLAERMAKAAFRGEEGVQIMEG